MPDREALIDKFGWQASSVQYVDGIAATVVLMAILLCVLLLVVFAGFCLVHLAAADRVRFLPKVAWAVVIVCASPVGGIAYLLSQHWLSVTGTRGATPV